MGSFQTDQKVNMVVGSADLFRNSADGIEAAAEVCVKWFSPIAVDVWISFFCAETNDSEGLDVLTASALLRASGRDKYPERIVNRWPRFACHR